MTIKPDQRSVLALLITRDLHDELSKARRVYTQSTFRDSAPYKRVIQKFVARVLKDAPSLASGSNKIQRTNSARTLVEFELNVAALRYENKESHTESRRNRI